MAKSKNQDIDPILQAKYALQTYENMKQSITFFTDMVNYHIKATTSILAKLEKAEEEELNKTPND